MKKITEIVKRINKKKLKIILLIGVLIFIFGCEPLERLAGREPSLTRLREGFAGEVISCGGSVTFCDGDGSTHALGKYGLRLLPNQLVLFANVPENIGDICSGDQISVSRKFADTYSFINPFNRNQYTLEFELERKEEGCEIKKDSIRINPDSECVLVNGRNLGFGEGIPPPPINPANIGLDMAVSCPEEMYMKAFYKNDIRNLDDFSYYSDDYQALCCKETIELPPSSQ